MCPMVLIYLALTAYNSSGESSKSDEVSITTTDGPVTEVAPTPDIKANGSYGWLYVIPGDNLSVTVTLNTGDLLGQNADWWVAAETPFGWYHYDVNSGSWIPGLTVTYQGPLFALSLYEVLNMSGLPEGTYTFYFGVDTLMNGSPDSGIIYDSMVVNITTITPSVVITETENTGSDSLPILALATDKDGKETIAVIGEKDADGNITNLTGFMYVSPDGNSLEMELGADGLPVSLTDDTGTKAVFSDYTNSTVDVTFFDSNNNLLGGPVTVEINQDKFSEYLNLFSSLRIASSSVAKPSNKDFAPFELATGCASTVQTKATSLGIKLGGLVISGTACAGAIAGVVTWPIAVFTCSSFLLSNLSLLPYLEVEGEIFKVLGMVSTGMGLSQFSQCASPGLGILPCITVLAGISSDLIDIACDEKVPPGTPSLSIPWPKSAWLGVGVSNMGGGGSGTVTSDPAGINCGTKCSALYDINKEVTLTATPDAGSTFKEWSGACSGTDPKCKVTMDADKAVTATFTITVSAPTGFTATADGSTVYLSWDAVSGAEGYKLYYGNSCDEYTGSIDLGNVTSKTFYDIPVGTYYLAVVAYNSKGESKHSNCETVTVVAAPVTLTISKSGSGSGTVTTSPAGINCGTDCSETYDIGTEVTLTAFPDSGSTFTGWSGACTGTGTCAVTMDADKTVTATFTSVGSGAGTLVLNYSVTPSEGGGSTVTGTLGFKQVSGGPAVTGNYRLISDTGGLITSFSPAGIDTAVIVGDSFSGPFVLLFTTGGYLGSPGSGQLTFAVSGNEVTGTGALTNFIKATNDVLYLGNVTTGTFTPQ